MIRAVKILAIPASWKVVGSKDTACAWLGGHGIRDCASAAACHALVAEAGVILCGCSGVAHRHTETRWEGFNRLLLQVVLAQIELSIVYSKPA